MIKLAMSVTLMLVLTGLVNTESDDSQGLADSALAVASQELDATQLEKVLEAESISLESVKSAGDEVSIESSTDTSTGAKLLTQAQVDLASGSATFVIEPTDRADGVATIEIDILEMSDGVTKFTAVNIATGESETFDSTQGQFAVVPLIIGLPLAASVLQALFLTVAVVVIAGATYVIATEALKAIRERGSRYQHFAAARQPGGLYIGKGLTFAGAIALGRRSGDTYSLTERGARAVAGGVKNRPPEGPEIDALGGGKYYHYHPAKRSPDMHAFYGAAR